MVYRVLTTRALRLSIPTKKLAVEGPLLAPRTVRSLDTMTKPCDRVTTAGKRLFLWRESRVYHLMDWLKRFCPLGLPRLDGVTV